MSLIKPSNGYFIATNSSTQVVVGKFGTVTPTFIKAIEWYYSIEYWLISKLIKFAFAGKERIPIGAKISERFSRHFETRAGRKLREERLLRGQRFRHADSKFCRFSLIVMTLF
jgi:hypothetical protein